MNKKIQQGFTLIELMIVVAIIGILAAVALPAYQDYTVKAKLASAISTVESIKTAIGVCMQENNTAVGCDSGTNGIILPPKTKEVATIAVDDGVITITLAASGLGTGVDGGKVTVSPTTVAGQSVVAWTYAYDAAISNTVAQQYLVKNNPPSASS